ncbi:hypoxia induced family protein [Tieghemostelium lacteum]|uniref:Hypoxia induced family protein n=1 Tax=Tieghemostelium lacteum TaxID=361077 RepID=A0A152A428_TIELA|nr:hypoxia induced family protein [Tieghemostelium lacteum]|eukprot:KYR00988.1 hypoxia induced family protein [Tieghemostelium lacteum]
MADNNNNNNDVKEGSIFHNISRKFTIPPPPKNIAEGIKRDYVLVGGLLLTVGALSAGIWNHSKGGSQLTTNRLLKGRIWAQAFTVCAMGYYAWAYQKEVDDEEKKRKVILT